MNKLRPEDDELLSSTRQMNIELCAEIERLRAALLDLIERWPTEQGYDGAIQRARQLLIDSSLRSPTKESLRRALKLPEDKRERT